MKILRLKLKNFIHIYSGMGKYEVELDLRESNKQINIFIGKMGSGKTAILGHLQPFASYGTLDARSQEDLILPEKDGLKEIDYLVDGVIYSIQHKYTWNKSSQSHSIKSYIQRDGKELNENGNNRSFKDIIKREFGIEQNFLRLLRLGPNVANLINMKSTERKAFIASLLEDAEVYALLYSKLNEEHRSMNGALNVMSNKLNSLSADKADEMKIESEDLEEDTQDLQKRIQSMREEASRYTGINHTLLDSKSLEAYQVDIDKNIQFVDDLLNQIKDLEERLSEVPDKSIEELSIEYGKACSDATNIEERIIHLNMDYEQIEGERNQIRDYLLIQKSDNHLQSLIESRDRVAKAYEDAKRRIQDFQCAYSQDFLIALNTQIETFQYAIEELQATTSKVIDKIYRSDNSLKSWANKTSEILTATKAKLVRSLGNIQFSAQYNCPIPLYRPPMCPTTTCPFIQTHPSIINLKHTDKRNQDIVDLQNRIEAIDIQLAECTDLLVYGPKVEMIKKLWSKIYPVLDSIHALLETNLRKILLNLDSRNNWYDPDVLNDTIEKVMILSQISDLERQYKTIDLEVTEWRSNNSKYREEDLQDRENRLQSIMKELNDAQNQRSEILSNRNKLEILIDTMRNFESMREKLSTLNQGRQSRIDKIDAMKSNVDRVNENNKRVESLMYQIRELTLEYNQKTDRLNKLKTILQDIKSTTQTYEESLQQRNIIKLLLDAVSSKEGIPVIMVKIFLDECKSIVNELISDIFDDDLEILDFDLREDSNEFKIPYSINGVTVEDISSASQGQTAVISIALSFALCRKAMFEYNIMLLDEIDNSIHKRDREKFIAILSKQMKSVNAEQIFLITHNDIFQQSGLPVNVILTTPEQIDLYPNQSKLTLF